MPSRNKKKLKLDPGEYCRILGHSMSGSQCSVCKLSMSSIIKKGEFQLKPKKNA
jgi:hypothetical protein